MATVTGMTASRALAIEAASVVSGSVNASNHLILTTHGGTEIDAGSVASVKSRTAIVVAASSSSADWKEAAAYICDGTDDHVQLQAAIDQAITTKTPVYLSPGDFWVETSLLASDSIRLYGAGTDKTWIRCGDALNDYAIKFTNATADGTVAAHISNFSIDGRCNAQTSGGGIYAMGAVECFFDHLHITNAYNWGLVLAGMAVGGAFGHNNRVEDCHFNASLVSDGFGGGIWMTSNDENDIRGCTFQFLGGATPPVSTLPVALLDQSSINNIEGCTFVGAQPLTNTIHLRLHDTKLTKVVGCMFDGSAGHSIFATGTGHVIMGNAITSPGDQGTSGTYSGIYLEFGARGILVMGNSLETSPTAGKTHSLIRESSDGSAGGNLIIGNTIKINGAGTPSYDEFDLSGAGSIYRMNMINPGGTIFPPEDASETQKGLVELATNTEAATGTDTTRAVTPANIKPLLDAKLSLTGGTMAGTINETLASTTTALLAGLITADTFDRIRVFVDGLELGSGAGARDVKLSRTAANQLSLTTADFRIASVGRGVRIAEGTNAKMGVVTLAGGAATVANTSVTASSRIFLTGQDDNGGTPGSLRVSARVVGTSFTITSSSASDISIVAWEIKEPA